MITKQAYATPGVWKISPTETVKQLAGPCEVSSFKLIATGSSAHVKIYDSVGSQNPTDLKWVLDASQTACDSHDFVNPLAFNKGVYAVCENGEGFNPIVCLATVTPR